ncbi:MAG TPA: Nramp family divalent metal transporter [Sphingomicrobium sp.]|nr:Nramp family divalent metal transporter [Sphingomicrobium sp.]
MGNGSETEHKPANGSPAAVATHAKRKIQLAIGRLGPGLITGAADDDPSGIATYSQAGAQFGLNMLWSVILAYPLMVAVQATSARIGRVTGKGVTANLRDIFPTSVVGLLVVALFVANTVNIGADLAAVGAAGELLVGRGQIVFTLIAAAISVLLQLFVPYHLYVRYLKWLTFSLLAYVAVVFSVQIDWSEVATRVVLPNAPISSDWLTVVIAVFGTTISPYLMYWQSSEEVEEMELKDRPELRKADPKAAERELRRIRIDTLIGMGVSDVISFFIILTTAVTLHQSGHTDIQSSAEAAQALRPIAGPFAFLLFSLGIIGTGFLSIPTLAGSTAYAAAELMNWKEGLEKPVPEARGFYAVIVISMVIALGIIFSPLDPIKALFWSAVLNGVISVPILGAIMVLASRRDEMGQFIAPGWQRLFGWTATAVMGAGAIGMIVLAII